MVWNTPFDWTAGGIPTAAQLDAGIRDPLKAIGDPWTAYTPVWTGSTTDPVIGNGSLTGGYVEAGKLIHWWAEIIMGSTTTYGSGQYSISLPVAEAAHRWRFSGIARDSSALGSYAIAGERLTTAGVVLLRGWPTTAGNPLTAMSPTFPFTLANTDVIFVSGTLEAA